MNEKYVYIIFSSTPFKLGKLIRKVTNYKFNHVSVCIDAEETTVYSFARHFKDFPFYGGFVKESSARYIHNDECAYVKLCAIPVTDDQHVKLKRFVAEMEKHPDKYIYNHFSAVGSLFHKKVKIKNAYTCVEFVTTLLNECDVMPEIDIRKYYPMKDLEKSLNQYVVYEGSFKEMSFYLNDQEDTFYQAADPYTGIFLTFYTNMRLFYTFLRNF